MRLIIIILLNLIRIITLNYIYIHKSIEQTRKKTNNKIKN